MSCQSISRQDMTRHAMEWNGMTRFDYNKVKRMTRYPMPCYGLSCPRVEPTRGQTMGFTKKTLSQSQ